jgi:hypothetical protein
MHGTDVKENCRLGCSQELLLVTALSQSNVVYTFRPFSLRFILILFYRLDLCPPRNRALYICRCLGSLSYCWSAKVACSLISVPHMRHRALFEDEFSSWPSS